MANIDRVKQALSAAESSLRIAKQLLNEVEGAGEKQNKSVLPGTIGTYDGENMVMESGEKHPVPANYASKSMLVVGDTLKLVDEKGNKRFKQIEHVKRLKTEGVLTKKDGKFHVLATEGSYKVLPAAVDHFGVGLDDTLNIWIPAKNQTALWAAIESVVGKEKESQSKEEEKFSVPVSQPEKKEDVSVQESSKSKTFSATPKTKAMKIETPEKEKIVKPPKPKAKTPGPIKKTETGKSETKKTISKTPKALKPLVKDEVDDEELA